MEKHCAECGRAFVRDIRSTYAQFTRQKYCSKDCVGKAKTRQADQARIPLSDAFYSRVEKGPECWTWTGAFGADGYPVLMWARKSWRANRVAVMVSGREIGSGQFACHSCDNPKCVNPAHIFVGSPHDNVADAVAKGRNVRGDKTRNAKLTEAQALEIKSSKKSASELAAEYGVTANSITNIISGRTWRYLHEQG